MKLLAPILVTGGTGFIGRKLVDLLLEKGHQVASFALPGEPVPEHWGARVKVIRGDITQAQDVRAAMQGIKTVFHLAAVVGLGAYEKHRQITIEGSRHIFDAALDNDSKVLLAASIVVYGHQIQNGVCDDDMPHGKHQGSYSWAKMAQEKLALEYRDKGMPLTVIRPANVYGVGSGPWVEGLFSMITNNSLPIIGDGSGNSGLVHVDNLVDAFVMAASSEEALGKIYTVCDGLDVSWSEYFHGLADMLKVSQLPKVDRQDLIDAASLYDKPELLEIADDMPTMPLEFINLIGNSNLFDSTRIRQELGWKPKTTYEQALAEIKESLKA